MKSYPFILYVNHTSFSSLEINASTKAKNEQKMESKNAILRNGASKDVNLSPRNKIHFESIQRRKTILQSIEVVVEQLQQQLAIERAVC